MILLFRYFDARSREEETLEVKSKCYAKDKVKSPPFFRSFFYIYQSGSAQEFEDHEAVLLDLASKYLKRRITLIPFLEGGQEQSFFPNDFDARNSEASKASSYHLLCCNKAANVNFFISIFRK